MIVCFSVIAFHTIISVIFSEISCRFLNSYAHRPYKNSDHSITGAFIGDILVGVLGICKTSKIITIRHISVPFQYQRQGIGTLLLEEVKKQYEGCKIMAETDTESVDFYAKSGFTCHEFKEPYGNLRYKCEFNI